MNTLLIPLLILYLVLLARYVHGRLTLRDRIVRECVAESMKREAEMRRLFRRDYDAVVEHRDKIVYEFRKMEEHARNVTLLECKNKGLIRSNNELRDKVRDLVADLRKSGKWESCAHRLYDSVNELQVIVDSLPDKKVTVTLPWSGRETRIGDILDHAYASIAIAKSVMFPDNKQGPGFKILANMPSVLQQ